jgi:hypothetical protein
MHKTPQVCSVSLFPEPSPSRILPVNNRNKLPPTQSMHVSLDNHAPAIRRRIFDMVPPVESPTDATTLRRLTCRSSSKTATLRPLGPPSPLPTFSPSPLRHCHPPPPPRTGCATSSEGGATVTSAGKPMEEGLVVTFRAESLFVKEARRTGSGPARPDAEEAAWRTGHRHGVLILVNLGGLNCKK